MATILPFMHTDYTLQRRVERACAEHEREMMARAAWMYRLEDQAGCWTEEDWVAFLNGDYEL